MVKPIDAVDIADITDIQPMAKSPSKTKKPSLASRSSSVSLLATAQKHIRDISTSTQGVSSAKSTLKPAITPIFSQDIKPSTFGPFYIPSPHFGDTKQSLTQNNEIMPTTNTAVAADSFYALDIVGSNLSVKMLSRSEAVESQWRAALPDAPRVTPTPNMSQALDLSPPLPVVRAVPVMRSPESNPSISKTQSSPLAQSLPQSLPEAHIPAAFASQVSTQTGMVSSGAHSIPGVSNTSTLQRAMAVSFNDVSKKLDQQPFSVSSPVSQLPKPAVSAHPQMSASTYPSMSPHTQSNGAHSQIPALSLSSMSIPASTPVSSVGRVVASSIATSAPMFSSDSVALPTSFGPTVTDNTHRDESTAQKGLFSSDQAAQQPSSASAPVSLQPTSMPVQSQSAGKSGRNSIGKADADPAQNQQNPNRLSDGFIVLISIAMLFVCALLFYFYMRRRRRRRASLISHSRSLHSSKSSLPSMLPGDEAKYQSPSQLYRQTPDSGTSLNFRPKATTFDEKLAKTHAINTLSLHPASIAHSHSNNQLQNPRAFNSEAQEFNPVEAVSKRYLNYRGQSAAMVTQSTVDARQSFNTARSQAADSAMIPSVNNAKHTRFNSIAEKYPSDHRRVAGTISYDTVSPIRARLPPSPLQNEAGIYGHQGAVTHHKMHTRAFSSPGNDSDNSYDNSEDPLPIINTEFSSKRSLLDTSAANPDMNSPGKGGSPGLNGKPRKLMRDGAKKGSPIIQGKTKNTPSPGSKRPAIDTTDMGNNEFDQPEASETLKQSKSSNGISIKTMFKSFGNASKSSPSSVKPAEISMPTTAALAKIKTDNVKLMPITQPLMKRNNEPMNSDQGKTSPLLESIESISESYQFAIRHKPPLGPLRVVEPHSPALPDELVVERGHHMFVIGEFADGWILAVNISRNSECGMIPRRCLFFPTASFMTSEAIEASSKGSSALALSIPVPQSPRESQKKQVQRK
ncbi:hypothetical protein FB645_000340 [Coemansia sp. IMI 203386]|nr:hypothetical protein FB645_000340 [Coemansia sp. IMI 203386]